MPKTGKVLCIDFDGTIVTHTAMNKEVLPHYVGSLKPKAAETIRKFKEDGFTIIIQSGRLHPNWNQVEEQTKLIKTFLKKNKIPYDGLISKHPTAAIFIDDKSLFHEDWKVIYKEVKKRCR